MKKIALALVLASFVASADETTINITMGSMAQGLSKIQAGFLYNNKKDVLDGIKTIEEANSVFKKVDVSSFMPNNKKIQVTKNINHNLEKSLESMKKDVKANKFAQASEDYSKVLNNCMACHTIIRGW